MATFERLVIDMALAQRLAASRKERGLTQQELADIAGVHVMQVHRYETGASQPSVEVLKKLATALRVTTDELLFGKDERGPDEELRLQLEAISRLDPQEKEVVIAVLDSLLLRHDARRWTAREKAS